MNWGPYLIVHRDFPTSVLKRVIPSPGVGNEPKDKRTQIIYFTAAVGGRHYGEDCLSPAALEASLFSFGPLFTMEIKGAEKEGARARSTLLPDWKCALNVLIDV